MNHLNHRPFAFLVAGAAAVAAMAPFTLTAAPPEVAPAGSASVSEAPTALWIAVRLPKDTNPEWVGDDVAESFADYVSRALHEQGMKGVVGTLSPEDAVPSRAVVLEVNLIEWSARAGAANCRFRAALRTPEGSRDLGIFSGDAMIVTGDGVHRVSSSGLRDAARFAMADLYSRLGAAKRLASR